MSKSTDRIVQAMCDELNDEEKARVAAVILSEVDPTLANLTEFWIHLDENVVAELASRVKCDEFPE